MNEGFKIDRYEITGTLGTGGNGRVYLGLDPKLEREVAIKVVHPELASNPVVMQRFHREARAIARLHHSNILEVFDYSGPGSALGYLVVERLHGCNLQELIEARGPLTPLQTASVGYEIALALAHAHGLNIVHRDLKPENIFLEPGGRVVLCDFGIARSFDSEERGTLAGHETALIGTPLYMSPEQITDPGSVAESSDVFALGSVLFFLATGKHAFAASSVVVVYQRVVSGEPTPIRSLLTDAPSGFLDVITTCMQTEPPDRYASATAVAQALSGVVQQQKTSDPRLVLAELAALMPEKKSARPIDRRDAVSATIIAAAARPPLPDTLEAASTPPIERRTAAPTPLRAPKRQRALRFGGGVFLATAAVTALLVVTMVVAQQHHNASPEATNVIVATPANPDTPPSTTAPKIAPPTVASPALSPPTVTPAITAAATPSEAKPALPSRNNKKARVDNPPTGPAVIRLVALPWADVFIDDQKVGTTPIFRTTTLPAGRHTLRLVNPNFPALSRVLQLQSGQSEELRFDLARGQ